MDARRASAIAVRCRKKSRRRCKREADGGERCFPAIGTFEGRVNPLVRANYLASPPLVVAYALAGRRGYRSGERSASARISAGADVYLRDIWPSPEEVQAAVKKSRAAGDVREAIFRGVPGRRAHGTRSKFRRAIFTRGTIIRRTSSRLRISMTWRIRRRT